MRAHSSIASIASPLGRPEKVLADNGYANDAEVASLAKINIEALVATGAEGRRRRHDFRPPKTDMAAKESKAEWLKAMAEKLAGEEGRALYKLRQQTVEPVFGIIKAVLGFRRFSMRGLDKVAGEWGLPISSRCICMALVLATGNQLRLWFASLAYVPIDSLRRIALAGTALARATAGSIRVKLLKIGGRVTVPVRRLKIAMTSAQPWRRDFSIAHERLSIAAC